MADEGSQRVIRRADAVAGCRLRMTVIAGLLVVAVFVGGLTAWSRSPAGQRGHRARRCWRRVSA